MSQVRLVQCHRCKTVSTFISRNRSYFTVTDYRSYVTVIDYRSFVNVIDYKSHVTLIDYRSCYCYCSTDCRCFVAVKDYRSCYCFYNACYRCCANVMQNTELSVCTARMDLVTVTVTQLPDVTFL